LYNVRNKVRNDCIRVEISQSYERLKNTLHYAKNYRNIDKSMILKGYYLKTIQSDSQLNI